MSAVYEIFGYYDSNKVMCIDPNIHVNSNVAPITTSHPSLMEWILFSAFALSALMLLLPLLKRFLSKKITDEKDDFTHIRIPKLYSPLPHEYQNLFLMPSYHGLFTIFLVTLSVCLAAECYFDHLLPQIANNISNLVTIQISVVTILFPLLILILEKDSEHAIAVKRSEILLRYSWGFPASTALITLSAYFIISSSKWGTVFATTLTLIIVLLVLFWLLKVTFSLGIYKSVEKNLLKYYVSENITAEAINRMAFNISHKCLEGKHTALTSKLMLFKNRDKYDYIEVDSPRHGVIVSIDTKRLLQAIDLLVHECSKNKVKQLSAVTTAPRDSDKYDDIKVAPEHLGKNVTKEHPLVATIQIPRNILSGSLISKTSKTIISAFGLEKEADNKSEVVEVILSRIGQLGRKSVMDEDHEMFEAVRVQCEDVYSSFCEILEYLKIHYDINSAKEETSLWGMDWKPFEAIEKNIYSINDVLTTKDGMNVGFIHKIIYLPYSLSMSAKYRNEPLGFYRFTTIAINQTFILSKYYCREQSLPLKWLGAIVKYSIIPEIEDSIGNQTILNETHKYWRQVISVYQHCIKTLIETATTSSSLGSAIQLLREATQIYTHDEFKYQIEHYKFMIKNTPDQSHRTLYEKDLNRLIQKNSNKELAEKWYMQSILGLSGYCLQIIDGTTKGQSDKTREVADYFLRQYFGVLPSSIGELVTMYSDYYSLDIAEKWGWERWEEHKPGNVYSPHTNSYIERIFALLFAKTACSSGKMPEVASLKIDFQLAFRLRDEQSGLRASIKNIKSKAENEYTDQQPTEEQLKRLFDFFDSIVKQEEVDSALKIVSQKISQQRYDHFKTEFVEAFTSEVILRNRLRIGTKVIEAAELKSGWGISALVDRSYFVDDPKIHGADIGKYYGEDLARSEDEYILAKIIEKAKSTPMSESFIKNSINTLTSKKVPIANIIVLTTRTPDIIRTMRQDALYTPKYRLKKIVDEKISGIYQVSGHDIPVYELFIRREDNKDLIAVVDRSVVSVTLGRLSGQKYFLDIGFFIKLVDPNSDTDLRNQLLEENPDWLSKYPVESRDKLVGKNVWVKIIEDINVEVADKERVVVTLLPNED